MGLRFFRRIGVFPGLRVNLSRSGASLSVGRRGVGWLTVGPAGLRGTVGRDGLYWTTLTPWRRLAAHDRHAAPPGPPVHIGLTGWCIYAGAALLALEALLR